MLSLYSTSVLSLHSHNNMVHKKTTTPANKDFDNEKSVKAEMRAAMDDLLHYIQTLEHNVHHIQLDH